ncbi:MAG TPA: Spy/CpxP family protein refolding chaperone [Syntrophorhabdaceae bacterium]|nr:Spy/CpxP family protein refolding chaperone [Syntrophorhabdaceae bacterium]HPU29847.1 Spy/CpxP family protein refolding chaperone [Syntrophorhabdaceae bacterium]
MKRLYVVGLLVAFFLMLVGSVYAFGPKRAGFGPDGVYVSGSGHGHAYGFLNLNLSKEQQDKMWQLKERFRSETERLRYETFQKRQELKRLYADPTVDKATLLSKEKELNALNQALQDKKVQLRLEQRAILTPEQLKKLGETGFGRGMGFGVAGFKGRGFAPAPCWH